MYLAYAIKSLERIYIYVGMTNDITRRLPNTIKGKIVLRKLTDLSNLFTAKLIIQELKQE